ncbi:MAG: CBS domain-containing protein [Thermoanaerobaculia bacterium]|nr:CBS domain-containing protein [Thermoanaerobaculia bacterium]
MTTIADLLERKGNQIYSINPDAKVFDAITLMAEKEIGALLVMEGKDLKGILSERDYARKVILKGKASRETPVGDIMSTRVVCVSPERNVDECMAVMTENRIRHLPVMDGAEVVGVVSIGDLVKSIIEEQKFVIEQLQNYIGS